MSTSVVSRVAEFIVGKSEVTFVGFIEPTGARKAGRSYTTLVMASAVLDVGFRNDHDGQRSPGIIPGTVVKRAAWDTVKNGIHRNGVRTTGSAITRYRNKLNARTKADRALIKRFEAGMAAAAK